MSFGSAFYNSLGQLIGGTAGRFMQYHGRIDILVAQSATYNYPGLTNSDEWAAYIDPKGTSYLHGAPNTAYDIDIITDALVVTYHGGNAHINSNETILIYRL